jgi:hypothetical protein
MAKVAPRVAQPETVTSVSLVGSLLDPSKPLAYVLGSCSATALSARPNGKIGSRRAAADLNDRLTAGERSRRAILLAAYNESIALDSSGIALEEAWPQ